MCIKAISTFLVKYLVFLFNLLFLLAGLALLIVGIMAKIDIDKQSINSVFSTGAIIVIVVGALTFVVAFLGCCGAIGENTCMLQAYGGLILCLLIIQVAVGIYCFVTINDALDFKNSIKKELDNLVSLYNKNDDVKEVMDYIQKERKCCGVTGPGDWNGIKPSSCGDYDTGCLTPLTDFFRDSLRLIGALALGLCAVQLVATIFAFCLSSCIKNDRRRSEYA